MLTGQTDNMENISVVRDIIRGDTKLVNSILSLEVVYNSNYIGGGPTPFLYMATRFLANVHVQNVQNVQKLFFPVWKFPGKIYLLWLIHNDRYITWECI